MDLVFKYKFIYFGMDMFLDIHSEIQIENVILTLWSEIEEDRATGITFLL